MTVNGKTISEPGSKADPDADDIRVDGRPVPPEKRLVVAFNKPAGCVTTAADTHGRETVFAYLRALPCRVFPVGRLDLDTEGLLLLTNDGALANRIAHPTNKIIKTYEAWVAGRAGKTPAEKDLEPLRGGVVLDGRPTAPAEARILKTEEREIPAGKSGGKTRRASRALVEIRIGEGRKRQVRRMFREIGCDVVSLKRTRIGGLALGGLKKGKYRMLEEKEIEKIFE